MSFGGDIDSSLELSSLDPVHFTKTSSQVDSFSPNGCAIHYENGYDRNEDI